jgi:hypothetical protein
MHDPGGLNEHSLPQLPLVAGEYRAEIIRI